MRFSIVSFLLLALFTFSACEKDAGKDEFKKDEYKKEECLYLIYPVTWTMPDDTQITPEDEKDFWVQIKAWYEVNPDVEIKPVLVYPVDVKLKDGTIETVEDEPAMIQLKEEHCDDGE